jgi:quercetin dioxygenase-like cupin family protein
LEIQIKRRAEMKYSRGRQEDTPSERRTGGNFTGNVFADPIVSNIGEGAINVGSVLFEPGARTFWHKHSRGQVLLVTCGEGRVSNKDGNGRRIRSGDVVQVDPGEIHWHGAGPASYMVHTSVTLGIIEWGSEVTDAEYSEPIS